MRFFKKIVFLSFPFILLTAVYIYTDPYKNIWTYDNYLFDYLMLNRGDISTRVYLKNRKKYNYNSFIFGSSRSTSHTSKEWTKYLSKNDTPYSFGSWNDPVYGIYRKILLIDSLKGHIDNAIIIIDLDKTFLKSNYGVLDYDHYLISGKSELSYHFSDFMSYIVSPQFILTSLDYKIFHTKRPYMKGFIGMKEGDLDPVNNDWYPNTDEKIDTLSYSEKPEKFYLRPDKERYSGKQILDYEKGVLLDIAALFKKHKTNLKIIIAPLYDQIKINPEDLFFLQYAFDKKNIYDYSGINKITNNKYNYEFDVIHYHKSVGKLIFREIYQND